MKKMVMVLVVLMAVGAGQVFAQQGQGFIQPTFGLGFGMTTGDFEDSGLSFTAGVNFVHASGFTITTRSVIQYMSDMDIAFVAPVFGLGYTFDDGGWNAGANFVFSSAMAEWAGGINLHGTFWVTEGIGLTAMMDALFFEDTYIGFWVGISMRF